ncbi:UDP-glycosyltransferase 76B1 isoform X1 [Populus trichocarpa]|uniref:UDP-glycosyltransferase 76B1 isoform X1 n=1 Tax=Populus trichocarpa TaxID=3694 RepID=UPI00227943ED|nr:UDP-glycosyltransferase 76B1 isoform X1 [Populus trichocarpa]
MENIRESHVQHRKCRRIILFPLPLEGHINPMIQLANILYSKGFSITIIHTQFNPPNPAKCPHFTIHAIPDGLLEDEASTADGVIRFSVLISNCVEPFRDCLAKLLLDAVDQEPVACLITDAVWHFTHSVAEGFKIPTIAMRTTSISSFLAFASFPLLRERGYFPIQDSRLEESVQELPPLKVKDLPVIKTRCPATLHQLYEKISNQAKACSGLIWNSFEEIERDALSKLSQVFTVPIFHIGPFHKYFPASSSSLITPDQSCISWLDTQTPNSVLYVSFGSLAAVNETEFLEMAWGLLHSNQPFLWVVRPGLVRGSESSESLPDGFLEMVGKRGYIVKWAPQQQVLAHPATGGFWTHNGWNSTLESICEGVPMICQPFSGDQRVNARYVSDVWKIGIHLEYNKLERREIERAIKGLMVETKGQGMRQRTVSLKEKANLCVSHGGSSYHSLENLTKYIMSF